VPTTLVGALIVGTCVAVVLMGLGVVQRLVPFAQRQEHNDVAGFIYAVLGILYAVLLAFVVVVVWQQYEDARAVNRAEANALADIYALAESLAEPDRSQVQDLARTYAEVVIREEWPLLADGQASDRAWEASYELQARAIALQPNTRAEQALYSRLLTQVSELLHQRRLRLLYSQDQAPPLLLWLLIGGGVVTVAFSYLFGLRNALAHSLMVAALAGLVAASILLINVLDFPYTGDFRLQPDSLVLVLQRLSGH
jgi:hypothetical protein